MSILYSRFNFLEHCFVFSKQFSVELRRKNSQPTVIFKNPKNQLNHG